ncbi:MAG: ABC transporter permease [Acidobacteriota bacterium]
MLQDLRLALRKLLQNPGFSSLALATLSTGIAANALIFGVVRGVLLEPLPIDDPHELVMLTREGDVSLPDGDDWRTQSKTLGDITLFLRAWSFDLTPPDGPPQRLRGMVTEPSLFLALRARPVLGRWLEGADDETGAEPVAVVSTRLWRERFGGRQGVLGTDLRLSGRAFRIVGVAPPELDLFDDGIDLWVTPAAETPWAEGNRGTNNFDALARLLPGAELEASRVEMAAISERLADQYPRTNRGKLADPIPFRDLLVAPVRAPLLVLLAAVGVLLAISGVNLTSLLLARSASRGPELATRVALGASRVRLLRQVLVETGLLGLVGGLGGLILAAWGKDLLLAWAPEDLPRRAGIGLDGSILGLALAVSLVVGVGIGILPAWRAAGAHRGTLNPGSVRAVGTPRQRLLGAMVVAETALAGLLLVAAGLLARSYWQVEKVELGFEPEGVWTAAVVLPESRYGGDTGAQTRAFQQIVDAIGGIPGVEASSSVIGAPLEIRGGIGGRLVIDDPEIMAGIEPGSEPGARRRPMLGDHFRALGQPVVAGRAFTAADHGSAPPVAIVNRKLADSIWGTGGDAVGRRIAWRPAEGEAPRWMEIVGIVADVKSTTLEAEDEPAVYTPYSQRIADWQRWGTLVVRVEGDPAALTPLAEEAVWSVDPGLPLAEVTTLAARRSEGLAQRRFAVSLLVLFALLAVGLAVLGLYGVLAYAVERRRRELGVRLALGASGRNLLMSVLRRGLAQVGAGVALAMVLARGLSGYLSSLVYGIESTDPRTFAFAAAALLACALVGCWLPARRAAAVDPVLVLRDE